MAIYSKICVMCNEEYIAQRITSAFCSRKCANKSRSLPFKLKTSLIERANRFTMKALKYGGMDKVMSLRQESAIGYRPNKMSKENPLGDEEGYLTALATVEADKSGIQRPSHISRHSDPSLERIPIDDEMTSFKLTLDEQKQEQPVENTENTENKVTEIPKRTGLRRVGQK